MSPPRAVRRPRLLFCCYHCYLDPSSGAALATRDLLELLTQRGWACGALCGPHLDFDAVGAPEDLFADLKTPFELLRWRRAGLDSLVYNFVRHGVPVTLYWPPDVTPAQLPSGAAGEAFLNPFDAVAERFRPDILVTYGGSWVQPLLMARAHRRGMAVVFALHNFAYHDAGLFRDADAVLVPSRFSAEHYRCALGLRCTALPGLCNLTRSHCQEVHGRHVTAVNPQPEKGLFWLARVAHELGRRRPGIPILVVEGRERAAALADTGLDWDGLNNMYRMAITPDPRDFYGVSRVLLMPSLWRESFGRVAVEALDNGIPVLASNRGALPETLGGAGLLFDVPARYTPESRAVPSAEEVAPWVETVVRLWDDEAFYQEQRRHCLAAAQAWQPERLLPQYEAFFQGLARHSGA